MSLGIVTKLTRRKCLFGGSPGSLRCLASPFLPLGSSNAGGAPCQTWQRGYADDGVPASAKKDTTLLVLNVEGKRNTSPVLLGLMDYFERFVPRVGFFQVHFPSSPGISHVSELKDKRAIVGEAPYMPWIGILASPQLKGGCTPPEVPCACGGCMPRHV